MVRAPGATSLPSFSQRVTSGIGWLSVAQIVRRLSGLVVAAVLARILSPQDFGLVALGVLATQLLGIVTDLGLTSSLVQRRTVDDTDLSTGFWVGLAFSLLLAAAGFASAGLIAGVFNEPRLIQLVRVMLVTLPLSALGQVPDAILQRRLDFRSIARIDWVSGLGSGILGVAAAFAGYGLWALVVQFVSATVIAVLMRHLIVDWVPRRSFDATSARQMVAFGSSLVGLGLVNYAAVNVDNALIGARIGTAALGYYMLAYNLVLLPSNNIGGLVTRVMFPALSSIQTERERFVQAYAAMLRAVSIATFPVVIGLGVTAPIAIATIYGPQWEPAVILLQILTMIGVLQSVNVCGVAYAAIGRPQILLAWSTLSVLVMTLGFAIGSRWGVAGVAWSYLIVSPVVFFPPHLIANRLIGLPQREFLRVIGAPFGASVIMGAIVLTVRLQVGLATLPVPAQLAILILIGIAAYGAILFALAFAAGTGQSPLKWITRHSVRVAEERTQT